MKRKLLSAYIKVRTYTTALLLGVAIGLAMPAKATTVPQDINAAVPAPAASPAINTTVPQDVNTTVPQDVNGSVWGWLLSLLQ